MERMGAWHASFVVNNYNDWIAASIGVVVKLLLWTAPAIFLIKRYEADMVVSLKGMVISPVNWIKFLPIIGGYVLYALISSYFLRGAIAVNPSFQASSLLGTVLFVGITEETAFRGFLLNALLIHRKPRNALLLNASLFLIVHFPIWFYRGMFLNPIALLGNCLMIFVQGIIFGWSFVKSRNIFVPILLHMVWNLLSVLFLG